MKAYLGKEGEQCNAVDEVGNNQPVCKETQKVPPSNEVSDEGQNGFSDLAHPFVIGVFGEQGRHCLKFVLINLHS